MKHVFFQIFFLSVSLVSRVQADSAPYFPPANTWQTASPSSQGMDASKLNQAVTFARDNEYSGDRDLRIAIIKGFSHEPFHKLLGPVKERGGPAGVIIRNGYQVASWGDLERVDMTFSVTKSYLSTVAGLAWDRGLLRDTGDKVADYVWDSKFASEHNSKITWHHLLNQSSDWSGNLFGLYDWADRPPKEGGLDDWQMRNLNEPGSVMEYNDVRVNLLAFSLLQVWRRPLPEVLKQQIMDPIGASTTWRWFGYDHAWVTLDGQQMQSVTGGGHSGGGVFINTLDQARFGLLVLNQGRWQDKQLLSREWLEKATRPSEAHDSYGYMWWLNQGQRKWQQVDHDDIFYAAGFGGNFIVVDRKRDLLIVTRWLEPSQIGEFVARVLESVK